MAHAQHKLSRRALLAGACALPLSRHPELVSGSSPPPPGPVISWTLKRVQGDDGVIGDKWREALARFREADAALEALVHCPNQRVYDRALSRHSAALARLLRAPAPDLAAAARKLELIVRHRVSELRFGEAAIAVLRRDIGRFAARSAS